MNRYLQLTMPPQTFNDIGRSGIVAVDKSYLYVYSYGGWRKAALSTVSDTVQLPLEINLYDRNGVRDTTVCYNNEYLFIYYQGWKSIALSPINPSLKSISSYSKKTQLTNLPLSLSTITQITYGIEGMVGADRDYFYIYVGGTWKKFAISVVSSPIVTPPLSYIRITETGNIRITENGNIRILELFV